MRRSVSNNINIYYKFVNRSRSNVFSVRITDSNLELTIHEPRSDATAFIQGMVVGEGITRSSNFLKECLGLSPMMLPWRSLLVRVGHVLLFRYPVIRLQLLANYGVTCGLLLVFGKKQSVSHQMDEACCFVNPSLLQLHPIYLLLICDADCSQKPRSVRALHTRY